MGNTTGNPVELFKKKAKEGLFTVVELQNAEEAISYALDLCEKKEACKFLLAGCEQQLSNKGAEACERADARVVVAPALSEKDFSYLSREAAEKKFTVIKGGMRDRLAGLDVAVTYADMGIADTATLVLACQSEELRLATMIAEIHVAILPKSKLVGTSYEAEDFLNGLMKREDPMYTAFISGPSRTADIERVLAVGVHGPLELHVALVEG